MSRLISIALFVLAVALASSAATALTITLSPDPLNVKIFGSADMTITLGDLDPLVWDYSVNLSSGFFVMVPANVLIPHGETSAAFTVTAGGVEGSDLVSATVMPVSDTAVVNVVPEPTTALLIGAGLAGLALRGRRKA